MSQQEMFPQSERSSFERRDNQDPREQQINMRYDQQPIAAQAYDPSSNDTGEHPYAEGYQPADTIPHFDEKVHPKSPQRPVRIIGFWIGLTALLILLYNILDLFETGLPKLIIGVPLLIVAIVAVVIYITYSRQMIEPPFIKTFEVMEKANLTVNNSSGAVHVWPSEGNEVMVRATRYKNIFAQRTYQEPISCQQSGDTIYISDQRTNSLNIFNYTSIALDIFVPAHSSVQVTNKAGTIDITRFEGHINATTDAGSVHLAGAKLDQDSFIRTSAGTIDARQCTLQNRSTIRTNAGTLNFADCTFFDTQLRTDAGTINIARGQLNGSNSMLTSMGTINFTGTVKGSPSLPAETQPRYESSTMKTNMGTINVRLTAQSDCTIDARTDMGSVHNAFGNNSIGTEQGPRLELRSNMGAIFVGKM